MNKIKLNKYSYDPAENSYVCINNDHDIIPNRINVINANYIYKKNMKNFIDIKKNKSIDLTTSENKSICTNITNTHEKIDIINNFNKDLIYTVDVQFGSGLIKPTAELVIDTGSSDLWISRKAIIKYFRKKCAVNNYNPKEKKNSTSDKPIPISISYGSGTVNGKLYSDTISINNISVENQSFAIMNSISLVAEVNGILGFGFSSIANQNNTPIFIDNLYNKNKIKKKIFGFNCNELSIGDIDDEYKKNIKYIPLHTHDGYWSLKYNGLSISNPNNDSNYFNITNCNFDIVIADTGCSSIILPDNDFYSLIEYIGIDTSEITNEEFKLLPYIIFNLGSNTNQIQIILKPEHYTIKRIDGYDLLIIGGADEIGSIIIGDPLFRAYYCVFDMDNTQMGFSPIK